MERQPGMRQQKERFRSDSPPLCRDDEGACPTLTAEESENIFKLIRAGAQSPLDLRNVAPPPVPPPLPPKPGQRRLSVASSTETIQNPPPKDHREDGCRQTTPQTFSKDSDRQVTFSNHLSVAQDTDRLFLSLIHI